MKIVLLADVGGSDGYHAGDEAMLDAAVVQLRRRGPVDITVISATPTDTAERYSVSAVARIDFAGRGTQAAAHRDRRLAAVLALSGGRSGDRGAAEREMDATGGAAGSIAVIDAIVGADALIVTGGGNLSSSWPEHVYERVAALSIARQHRVPAVMTSQTIGPDLLARERSLLAVALDGVRLVGLRERDSLRLASTLLAESIPRRLQLDDAVDLPETAVPSFDGDDRLGDGFVGFTINPRGDGPEADARLAGLASLVRRVHERTGLSVVFLPHVGRWTGERSGDVAVGEALHERMGHGPELIVCPLLPARQLASLTRRAKAIVSTRYHPIVFGLAAAVPCLAIYQDRYTSVKLTGALTHAGLAQWRVPLDALVTDVPGEVFDELWSRRDELVAHLSAVTADWPHRQREHWDELWRAVTEPLPALTVERVAISPPPDEATPKLAGLAALNSIVAEQLRIAATLESRLRTEFLEAERYAVDLEAALAARTAELDALRSHVDDVQRDREIASEALAVASIRVDLVQAQLAEVDLRRASVEADNIQLLDETRQAEHAAQAARALVVELSQQLDDARTDAEARADQQRTYLEALHATKTMRWTRRPRQLYGRLRQLRQRAR